METLLTGLLEGLAKGGILAIILGIAFWYILYLHKQHKEEREEWKQITKDSIQSARDNSSILSALKQLLETTREKK